MEVALNLILKNGVSPNQLGKRLPKNTNRLVNKTWRTMATLKKAQIRPFSYEELHTRFI